VLELMKTRDKYISSRILAGKVFTHVPSEGINPERIGEIIRSKQIAERPIESSHDGGGPTIREAILLAHKTFSPDVARVVGDTAILEAIQASQKRNEGNVDLGTRGPKRGDIRNAIQGALFDLIN
jgi:hypothetical protein